MHPIEHLRHVARTRSLDEEDLVREAAVALAGLGADGPDLVVACRRIVERHPEAAALWWLCSRLLVADAPARLAWRIAEEVGTDRTPRVLAEALPDRGTVLTIGWPAVAAGGLVRRGDIRVLCADSRHRASAFVRQLERAGVECDLVDGESLARATATADVVVVDATAADAARVLAPIGSHVVGAVAASVGVPVWCVTGLGRRLPLEYVDAIADRLGGDPLDLDVDDLPVGLVTHVVSADGISDDVAGALRPECPLVPELLRSSPL
jgi:hypothetical protein